jgi:LAO/AO transport system kinase
VKLDASIDLASADFAPLHLGVWVEKIRQGDPRVLARALSVIENRAAQAESLPRALFPYSGGSLRIGITGAPGAGKSTLVNCLTRHLRRQGRSVAIVAVDPTSPYTGGAILGDRVRMQSHHDDPGVFIRSMATRGVLGGLAAATADVIVTLEASGRDVVIIETVGVGQAEIEVVKLASAVALVLTPAMGDDVQTLKAGIMEIADLFVINKADQPGADRIQGQLEALLSLLPADQVRPPILQTVATGDQGVGELVDALSALPSDSERAVTAWKERLIAMMRQRLIERVVAETLDDAKIAAAAREVAERRLNPYEFVDEVIGQVAVAAQSRH